MHNVTRVLSALVLAPGFAESLGPGLSLPWTSWEKCHYLRECVGVEGKGRTPGSRDLLPFFHPA